MIDNRAGFSSEKHRVNRSISAASVRLIAPDGEALGIFSLRDALGKAEEYGLDLVEISPHSDPPVCKILDYGKMKYDIQKKKAESKKKQKVVEIKEVKFTPMIGEHDLQIKLSSIRRFLSDGNKVKITLRFRGREISHQEIGMRVVEKVLDGVVDLGKQDATPKLEGRQIAVMVSPLSIAGK